MTFSESANALVRFALELCALAAFGYWGFRTSDTAVVEWLLGLGAPAAFAILWGAYIAPKAPLRIADPGRLVLELAVFALAVIALAGAGRTVFAGIFAVGVAINIALMIVLDQRRTI